MSPPDHLTPTMLGQNMLSSMLENERGLKEAALRAQREFRGILRKLAARIDARALEVQRQVDPWGMEAWTPAEWERFIFALLDAQQKSGAWGGAILQAEERDRLKRDLLTAQAASEKWRIDAENQRSRAQSLQARIAELEAAVKKAETAAKTAREKKSAAEAEETGTNPVAMLPDAHPYAAWAALLTDWKTPAVPAPFRNRVGDELQWRRQSMAIFLMATQGVSLRIELEALVSAGEGLKGLSTGSVRRAIDALSKGGLAITRNLRLERGSDFTGNLMTIRLSEDGLSLCRTLGWSAMEGDYARLVRLHQAESQQMEGHTYALLATVLAAHRAGWNTAVCPETTDFDLLLERDGVTHFVEVETRAEKDKSDKWRKLHAAQGYVAVVTTTAEDAQQIAADCQRLKLPARIATLSDLTRRSLVPALQAQELFSVSVGSGSGQSR